MTTPVYPSIDHRPLLDGTSDYFNDGLDEGIIIPPNPFADISSNSNSNNDSMQDSSRGDLEENDNDESPSVMPWIEKLGLAIGVFIGATVQLATLAGNLVNVTIWGREDGPYASTTFVIWCCFMSAMFFVAYAMLRCLVHMSLKMVYKMEHDNNTMHSNQQRQQEATVVVDIPSDNPMPSPSSFPTIGSSITTGTAGSSHDRSTGSNSSSTVVHRDLYDVLDDVMWHMKLNYVLGVSFGISLSWIATNLALGDQRVSLVFSLAPPLLGFVWFKWVKQANEIAGNKLPSNQGDTLGQV